MSWQFHKVKWKFKNVVWWWFKIVDAEKGSDGLQAIPAVFDNLVGDLFIQCSRRRHVFESQFPHSNDHNQHLRICWMSGIHHCHSSLLGWSRGSDNRCNDVHYAHPSVVENARIGGSSWKSSRNFENCRGKDCEFARWSHQPCHWSQTLSTSTTVHRTHDLRLSSGVGFVGDLSIFAGVDQWFV